MAKHGSWTYIVGGYRMTPPLPTMPSFLGCGMAGGNWTTGSGQIMVFRAVSTVPMVVAQTVSLVRDARI
jgi:hypothetical protein